ncbi:hypothetical protein KIPB_008594, partial [Kipferlia bialata]|eukprot:g8594.t1
MVILYPLFEAAAGLALFEVKEFDDAGKMLADVQRSVTSYGTFARLVSLRSFLPFSGMHEATQYAIALEKGDVPEVLVTFLEANLPRGDGHVLGVTDERVLNSMNQLKISCRSDETVGEVVRGIRAHMNTFLKAVTPEAMDQRQLSLAHMVARETVSFNSARQ